MSNDILTTTPEDRRRMDRYARSRSVTGTCGHTVDRSNLTRLKDGRSLCPECHAKLMYQVFGS